ncbi:MAG: dihydroorotate dehydrogenase catalytic subunit [Methanobacterium sp.]|jgi:dihydroorotate dehydrogenase (NAD+) catalytic subunit|uniref:dihydroorotate dehydrogenase n=1 Tax=Methanobacterium sp. TaxID=2164 RepID=UPI0003C958DB|nr:dihydroorotate dehydrogenase [Methanobacterium sp.]MDI3549763.1 dihydroorotate dehydrogenase catalytic subunit [Methanobacterium sp.]CDG65834.1 Dihydroorotate dehydrogenase B (NAD(+)), catalytic subunit [Methanobacterium sp. MB1]
MLEVEICRMKMKNPTVLAAGVLGSNASSLNWAARSGAGAVITKSFGTEPNKGYPNPTTVEVEGGIINAIGLSNPGVETFKEELEKLEGQVPQIASIYGSTPQEFSEIASKVENLVDALELNISCPHALKGCGASIGQDPDLTYNFVKSVKKTVKIPVIAKLTPNVTDIVEIAQAAERAGADALTLINSLGPGMRIDLETAHPILSNGFGGMSGPAIKPVALRCVYQVYQNVDIPLMGVGGITNYQDVVEFLYAGASCVQIGTAVMYQGLEVFSEINQGLLKFMKEKNYQTVEEMVGLAHQEGVN